MTLFLLMFFLVNTANVFAQTENVIPFIEGDKIGMQINSLYTGVRSSVANQETELNLVLYYHDRYDLRDDDILGMVEGRLITENPLSSFDLINQFGKDQNSIMSNYGNQYRIYQESLEQFRLFQELTNDSEYDEDDYNDGYDDDYYYDATSLSFIRQNFVAQSMQDNSNTTTNVTTLISDKELEHLIRIEKLKEEYQQLMFLYNTMVSNQQQEQQQDFVDSTNTFDPGDPSERFTIVISGLDDPSTIWSKSFGLDGVNNYQSYNKEVWFLGYKLPITKQDIRLLYNVFTKNKKIQYVVSGDKGRINFNLSVYFIKAVEELMDLYVNGKFKREDSIDFPMLRD